MARDHLRFIDPRPRMPRTGREGERSVMQEPIIEVRGLTKRFGDVQAVVGVDFDVARGELFGFLGPNGAGKTTTINMLIGLARPDAGTIRIAGIDCSRDPKAAQHLLGVVPDESNLYPELTGFENLCFCGSLYGLGRRDREERASALLDRLGLAHAAGRKFAGYGPRILFLDEPTTGIDVASARQIRQLIAELNAKGTTVFLTTHYIEEAERLCGRIAFIVDGGIVRIDEVRALMQLAEGRHGVQVAVAAGAAEMCPHIESQFPDLRCRASGGTAIRIESPAPIQVGPLVRLLEDQGAEVYEARRIRPSLEDVFVDITGIAVDLMKRDKEKKMSVPNGGSPS